MTNDNIQILIVDDEPDIIDFLSYNLKQEGYRTASATSGQQALQQAEQNP
ncbi:MAG: DNA-binding response regulator, partial [Bacteroidetes bacterium SW_11_45_7]